MKTIRILAGVLAISAFASATAAESVSKSVETNPIAHEVPYLNTKGERVLMNFLNVDLAEVRIKVLDQTGRVLYRETIEDSLVIEKAFNFEKAYEGEYRVVVEINGEKVIEHITVS